MASAPSTDWLSCTRPTIARVIFSGLSCWKALRPIETPAQPASIAPATISSSARSSPSFAPPAKLGRHSGRVLHDCDIVLVLDLLAARVHHRYQGHAPLLARHRHFTQVAKHLAFVLGTQVDVDGDGVRAVFDGALDVADEDLVVRIGAEAGTGRQVQDEPDVGPIAAVAQAWQAHMPQDRIRAAPGDVVHHPRHVRPGIGPTVTPWSIGTMTVLPVSRRVIRSNRICLPSIR